MKKVCDSVSKMTAHYFEFIPHLPYECDFFLNYKRCNFFLVPGMHLEMIEKAIFAKKCKTYKKSINKKSRHNNAVFLLN